MENRSKELTGAAHDHGEQLYVLTNSNCGPVSGECGKRLHFSTACHSFAIILRASAPFCAMPDSTSQQPTTIPRLTVSLRIHSAARPKLQLTRSSDTAPRNSQHEVRYHGNKRLTCNALLISDLYFRCLATPRECLS